MGGIRDLSRREFVTTAISTAAVSCLPVRPLLAAQAGEVGASTQHEPGPPLVQTPPWKDQGVENLTNSPFAKLHDIPVRAVTVSSGLWGKRREINVTRSIPTMHDLLEENGRMNNFRRLIGKSNAPQHGPVFSDSDVYKWTEAVGFVLQSGDRPALRETTEKMIADVVAAQEPSGYLNTYYQGDKASLRMLPETQTTGHELYCIGHLLQGAIAFYRATGDRTLLDAGIRFVDDFLLPNYGPAPKKPIVSGHPEIEMSLIELYRLTGDRRQLDLAGYILHGDDRIQLPEHRTIYMFCGTPFTERTRLEGHAVRAMYACCGATDYYLETGDQAYWKTLNTLWDDLVGTKMYITGGVGSRAEGEAFGDAYELPNFRAYGESCAAIGNMMWNWRMLAATGDAKFADVIERALYNGINSGMSLDGTMYCYRNPLGFDPSFGDKIRNPWYDVTCCPPNLERTFGSLPGYMYSTSKDGVYVHLYNDSELDWHLENGTPLKITQKTEYPWNGRVELTVSPAAATEFTLYVRIPGWSNKFKAGVNGKSLGGMKPGEYLAISRSWEPGDKVLLEMEMPVRVMQANPRVTADTARVAVERGPLVYCLEGIDQPSGSVMDDLAVNTSRNPAGDFHEEFHADLLGGVTTLHQKGTTFNWGTRQKELYSSYDPEPPKGGEAALMFIPYFAWANRESATMQVWNRLHRV